MWVYGVAVTFWQARMGEQGIWNLICHPKAVGWRLCSQPAALLGGDGTRELGGAYWEEIGSLWSGDFCSTTQSLQIINGFNTSPKAMATRAMNGNIWNREPKSVFLSLPSWLSQVFCHRTESGPRDGSISTLLPTLPHTGKSALGGTEVYASRGKSFQLFHLSSPSFTAMDYAVHILPIYSLPHTSLACHSDPNHCKAKITEKREGGGEGKENLSFSIV